MIEETASRSVAYWSTGNGDDTMVTLWNPADEAQDLIFAVFFAGGHYRYPVHLVPRATHIFNLSEIVHNQIADDEGNLIPTSIHEGSARISGSHAENEHILIAIDVGVYNVRKATCHITCVTCDGSTLLSALENPFAVAVSGTHQLSFKSTWNTGAHYDLTTSSSWSSNHTNLATVGARTGLVAGVAAGAVSMTATNTTEPIFLHECSIGANCLSDQGFGGNGSTPGTVVQVKSVAPSPLVIGSSGPMAIGGSGFSSLQTPISVNMSGTGVTVTAPAVAGDSLINATYVVDSNTSPGSQNLTVSSPGSDGGQGAGSNKFAVTIAATAPIPTSATIDANVHQTYSNQTWASCDGTQSQNNAYGYQNCITYQVNDQSGSPLYQNLTIQEAVSVVDPGNVTATLFTGNSLSNPTGQFQDDLKLISTAALPSNACNILKQSVTASGNSNPIRVNCLQFSSTNVMITDVTSNPGLCVKGTTYHCN